MLCLLPARLFRSRSAEWASQGVPAFLHLVLWSKAQRGSLDFSQICRVSTAQFQVSGQLLSVPATSYFLSWMLFCTAESRGGFFPIGLSFLYWDQ